MSTIKQKQVALMGFREVGKSSLAIQFVEGQFPDCYDPTIENTFRKKITVKRNEYEKFLGCWIFGGPAIIAFGFSTFHVMTTSLNEVLSDPEGTSSLTPKHYWVAKLHSVESQF